MIQDIIAKIPKIGVELLTLITLIKKDKKPVASIKHLVVKDDSVIKDI